ncbi:MAG: nucleotidyltransferase domain-containing protein [Nitrococcus sp.]|nr:nucleotidyltransferase domain-containing protein [Nitrococcus sp.]
MIDDNRDSIRALCRKYGVRKMDVFGSVLHEDFDVVASDVDVLVVFEPGESDSFSNFLDLKEALEALFTRPVDLLEPHTIRNRRLRHHIEQSSVPIYAAA